MDNALDSFGSVWIKARYLGDAYYYSSCFEYKRAPEPGRFTTPSAKTGSCLPPSNLNLRSALVAAPVAQEDAWESPSNFYILTFFH